MPTSTPQKVSTLKKKADAVFSRYIRRRDSDEDGLAACITCGTKKPWKYQQNGHFIKRSINKLRYDEFNCNAQCVSCNVYRYGEQYKYSVALDLKYGKGTAARLQEESKQFHKLTVPELLDLIEEYTEKIKNYES